MSTLRLPVFCLGLVLGWSAPVYAEDDLGTYPGGDFYPEMVADEDRGNFKLSDIRIPDIDQHLYPEPKKVEPHQGDQFKSCVALDDEIVGLMPLTYRTTPDFYDDPKVAAAIWLTTTGVTLFDIFPDDLPFTKIPLGYSLLAYPEYKKYKEDERIRRVGLRIESLRRSKARLRCFET